MNMLASTRVFASAGLMVLAGLIWHFAPTSTPPTSAQQGTQLPRPIDLIFIVDDSSCLAGGTYNGMEPLDAIAAGIDTVLEQLDPDRDRAALVGFGDQAEQVSLLTNDWDRLRSDFAKLTQRDGSARLDLAYREVSNMLRNDTGREDALVVTLLVTDGPMMQAPDLALAQAQDLQRNFGARHYNIAVGTIAQFALLRRIAEPGGMWTIPFGGDMIGVYRGAGKVIAELAHQDLAPNPTSDPAEPGTATPDPQSAQGFLPSLQRR